MPLSFGRAPAACVSNPSISSRRTTLTAPLAAYPASAPTAFPSRISMRSTIESGIVSWSRNGPALRPSMSRTMRPSPAMRTRPRPKKFVALDRSSSSSNVCLPERAISSLSITVAGRSAAAPIPSRRISPASAGKHHAAARTIRQAGIGRRVGFIARPRLSTKNGYCAEIEARCIAKQPSLHPHPVMPGTSPLPSGSAFEELYLEPVRVGRPRLMPGYAPAP